MSPFRREASAWVLTLISPTLTALEAHLPSAARQVAAGLKLCKNLPRILPVDLKAPAAKLTLNAVQE